MKNTYLKLSAMVQTLMLREEGQDLIEYGLLAGILALACVATMQGVATDVNTIFTNIANALTAA